MKWKEAVKNPAALNLLLLFLAALSGWTAVSFAQNYLEEHAHQLQVRTESRYRPRPVIVARTDLAAGESITAGALAIRDMPGDFIPSGALDSTAANTLLGRRLASGLRRGDPVTPASLAPEAPRSLAEALPVGQRAITLPVDEINSLSGMLSPGDRVDLYLSQGHGTSGSRLLLLQERVQVLATGADRITGAQGGNAPQPDFGTITLLVTAEQAGRIVLAQRTGSLTVVLRPVGDVDASQLFTRESRFLRDGRPPARAGATSPPERVELLLGGHGGPAPRREWLLAAPSGHANGERS